MDTVEYSSDFTFYTTEIEINIGKMKSCMNAYYTDRTG